MRKPVNQLPTVTVSEEYLQRIAAEKTAIVRVGTYEFTTSPTKSPFILFTASLPAQYRVEKAMCFRARTIDSSSAEKLCIRVRQFGEGAVQARFLVVWSGDNGQINLPHITPSPHDPPDSAMLQWSFWQGCRVGGGLYHDVFDVTHFELGDLVDAIAED